MSWKNTLPVWKNKGVSPSNDLLTNGFKGGYKPPAPLFNWFISSVIDCIKELQEKTATTKEHNLKVYTALSQIGLSGAVTMEQVLNALPEQSALFIANTNDTTAVNYVTDVPAQYGNLEVIRYSNARAVAQFTKGDDSGVMNYIGKYHSAIGWSGWIKTYSETNKPNPADIGAQPLHYYYNLASIGCEASSALTEVWQALPNNSILSYSSSDLTDASWNFPKIKGSPAYGTLLINKHSGIRAGIFLLGKAAEYKDYRMYLDDATGMPSGVWYEIYTSANKPKPEDIDGIIPLTKGGTGATNVNGAVRNLLVNTLIGNESIKNANTLVKTGIHKVYVTDEALAKNNNYPYVYGNLVVISNMEETNYGYVMQLFLTTNGTIFTRASTNTGSTWTEWSEIYSTRNKPTASDVGLGVVDISSDFISTEMNGYTVSFKKVYKQGNVINGLVTITGDFSNGGESLFPTIKINTKYKPKITYVTMGVMEVVDETVVSDSITKAYIISSGSLCYIAALGSKFNNSSLQMSFTYICE